MDKMWASFTGMGLMLSAAALVIFARSKLKGPFRFLFVTIAFVLLLISVVFMLASMS
ncbi:DUF2768 family protein [Gorillibacterium massiliense]|uniref:DUF2768 family protein n=1 Tax=Gorillibacterium massiliense TaxID=1280390 RepID=UPI001EE29526|nr:DUF2768 family protein [Gorillibacterium massiliense]